MINSAPPTTPYANAALSAHAHVGAHPVSGLKKIVNGDAVVTSGQAGDDAAILIVLVSKIMDAVNKTESESVTTIW